jgi:hypothetical protein
MLGGGVFVTQNKVLPGSYINFVNASTAGSAIGERGVVAIALPLGKAVGEVITINRAQFVNECSVILGKEYNSDDVKPLREIFRHANKVYIYDLGADGTVNDAVKALEACEFNVLCAYTAETTDIDAYIAAIKMWRDELGKKCQVVVYNQSNPDYEGVINVVSTISDDSAPEYALVAWLAGAEAGCKINESCTNMLYDGEYTIIANKTQTELEECIKNGKIAFHLVYDNIRLLEDVNSLVTTTADKGEDFKYNQTIRVIDQIANDIAKLFNTKYLGRIPNNASGRVSLWADIVAHHKAMEAISAIDAFDSAKLTVVQGATKKSVVINDCITVMNAMAQLYMTVVVQ